jgi:hypothetical protein
MSNVVDGTLELPLLKLRDYQQPIWDRWVTDGVKMMSLQWHRRSGKDLLSWQIVIAEAIREVGNYWYIFPQFNQARNAMWDGVTKEGVRYLDLFPEEMIHKIDHHKMKIYVRNPKNLYEYGSVISFVGGDNYDDRLGAGIKGAVISEHSLQKPNLYNLVISPMLKETKGWVIFNFTPRGENHATEMYDALAAKPECIASTLSVKDTGLVTPEEIQDERNKGVPEEIIQQEYYVSREGALLGSFYGDILNQHKDKVGKYPYDAQYPVHTLWDIGISDSMAIWFVQLVQAEIRVINFYENHNYALGHYAGVLKDKGYLYAMHHLPHDGTKRQLTEAEKAISVEAQLRNLGIRPIEIHRRRTDASYIYAVRALLPRCCFDAESTEDGREALKQYRREWDDGRKKFKDIPCHDWTSHAADAFSLLPYIEAQERRNASPVVVRSRPWNGNFGAKMAVSIRTSGGRLR